MMTRSPSPRPAYVALLIIALAHCRLLAQDAVERAPAPIPRGATPFDFIAYGDEGKLASARGRLEDQLAHYLDHVDRACTLTAVQRRKLELAGRGEIKRNFDQIEEFKRRYEATQKDHGSPKELESITTALQGLPLAGSHASFEYSSLLWKIQKSTLSAEQLALYRANRLASRERTHHARVMAIIELFDRSVGLTHDQRVKLTKVISAETLASRRLGKSRDEFLIFVSLTANIPESKIKPLLTAEQWGAIGKLLELWRLTTTHMLKLLDSLPQDPILDDPASVAIQAKP